MLLKIWENMQHFSMFFGLYEKLFNDETLLRPDEYIFLYTSSLNVTNRNKTREKELSTLWIDKSFTDYQNEFYETIARKIPQSRRISTTGKDKEYVSRLIAEILNVRVVPDKEVL